MGLFDGIKAGFRAHRRLILRVFEFLFVLLVLLALLAVNWKSEYLKSWTASQPLDKIWAPTLALLAYLAFRLSLYILMQLLGVEPEFRDVDEATAAGLRALEYANIGLSNTPLFVILGLTKEEEEAFAKDTTIGAEVVVADEHHPIHWYANRKWIWVTLPGVSALTQQIRRPMQSLGVAEGSFQTQAPVSGSASGGDTLAPGGGFPGGGGTLIGSGLSISPSMGPSGSPAAAGTLIGRGERFDTLAGERPVKGERRLGEAAMGPIPLSDADKRMAARRCRYFATLLRKFRYPVCTVNGMLIAIPYLWTTNDKLAHRADAAGVDVRALSDSLGVRCTCLTVLSGVSESEPFREFIQRFSGKDVSRRQGCGFPQPSLTKLSQDDLNPMHEWLTANFESHIFEQLRRTPDAAGNARLVQFLHEFRGSRSEFSRALATAFPSDLTEPWYFGGVYFASFTAVGPLKSPFLAGVLERLANEQMETICWNSEALQQDRRRYAAGSWVLAFVVLSTLLNAALVVLIVQQWFGKRS